MLMNKVYLKKLINILGMLNLIIYIPIYNFNSLL